MSLPNRQGIDLTVPMLQVDVPADIGDESALDGLCDRNMLARLAVMQSRDRRPVVVRPLAVLVFVDVGRNHCAETLLVEGAEDLDREVNKRGQVWAGTGGCAWRCAFFSKGASPRHPRRRG